jgi:glycosyltransferase involved in cell wall biosynthesis
MKILSITAGAAGMYCGSCTRDNALAAELIRLGHDVTLMPVYTPTRTDEPNVSQPRVLFGGISVYLQQHLALFRKTPRFLDRIWDSPRVIESFAGRKVSNDPRLLGALTISMLRGMDGVLRKEFEKLVEWIRLEAPPDVINLPNSLLIAMASPLRDTVNRPICCTLQGEELFINGLLPQYRDEALDLIRRQVEKVDRFIAVSEYCAGFMSDFLKIPAGKIAVVPLGITMDGHERRKTGAPHRDFRIGYLARIAPEKGLHVLADAYARLRERTGDARMQLDVAGYTAAEHKEYLEGIRSKLNRAGLAAEFSYRGVLDREAKLEFLRNLDVLSVPATYDEPKGMFVLEAMASGVPVVQPRRGAFTEIVEKTGGGVLVKADDADSLAEGFHQLWKDRPTVAALGERAFHGAREHYSVTQSAERLLQVFEAVTRPHAESLQH